uniref:Ribonuclease H-like domain-containing protein n=1 Tax=Tanacetum cinerariifolium TaxID=118510 RepID=A0A699T7P4_TANCI|nr:ribonuclease H-like domain-containing protein [Tanacetum cinerariifolium]
MGHFARECRAPKSQDRGRRDNYRQGSKVEEQTPKALMAIDRVGWDWSYMANEDKNHALVAEEEAPIEFALMAKTKIEQDDLNQKFLSSLALEWLMHTIVWRNMSDLNTMSLDDLYNHLKVYESEV